MKPIFTIHAGEYLVGEYIERTFKDIAVWIPSKDTGIDFLLTNKGNTKTASIQVKFSKDFNATKINDTTKENIRGSGWWTLQKDKIENSNAEFWVFVVYNFGVKTNDFIIMRPSELLDLIRVLNKEAKRIHLYFTVTNDERAFETRGISKQIKSSLIAGEFNDSNRELSHFLNKWDPILEKLGVPH